MSNILGGGEAIAGVVITGLETVVVGGSVVGIGVIRSDTNA